MFVFIFASFKFTTRFLQMDLPLFSNAMADLFTIRLMYYYSLHRNFMTVFLIGHDENTLQYTSVLDVNFFLLDML